MSTQRRNLTASIPVDLAGRARSAWRAENARGTVFPSFNSWLINAIEAQVLITEERLNDGKPFPETPAGVIPTGRQVQ